MSAQKWICSDYGKFDFVICDFFIILWYKQYSYEHYRIFKNRREERKFRYNLEKFVTYEEAVNYALEYIFVNFEILSHIDNE